MPALAPQEEFETITRRAATRSARSVSSPVRGATAARGVKNSRNAMRDRAFNEPRVLGSANEEARHRETGRGADAERDVEVRTRRRVHRDLNVSLTVAFFLILIFMQACVLLLLKGMSVTAMHQAERLGDATSGEIGRVNDEIALQQKQIAALGSPAQIKRWAEQRQWPMASPQAFDDIRQTAALTGNNDSPTIDTGTKP